MATVTTGIPSDISDTLARLEALYDEFDGSSDNGCYIIFEKIVAEFKNSKLSEPHLSSEIEKVQTAMAGHLSPSDVAQRIRSGRVGKKQSGDIEATLLYEIASHQIELFQDTTSNLYVRFEADIEDSPHYELHQLPSKPIRDYLRNLAKKELNKVVRRDIINSVLEQLQADKATPARLSYRIAQYDGAFYYDMMDQDWSAIRITPEAWEYCYYEYDLPPLFIANRQAEQVRPDSRAVIQDIKKLVNFLDIPGFEQQLLSVVWLISTFIPTIKRPIIYVYGGHSSGKTSFMKAVAQLADPTVIDPSPANEVKVLAPPRHSDEALTHMAHRHLVAYDNMYSIPGWFSQYLSVRTTVGTAEKKKLYTDSEPHEIGLAGPTILNGIHRLGLQYTDLQSRIIAIKLEQRENNKSEAEYWKRFNGISSTALGAIFSIISRAMAIEPTLQIKPISRFVDFERWGCAITQAMREAGLSYSQTDFLTAYRNNIKHVRYSVLENHPIAQCLIHLRDTAVSDEWAGTPSDLFDILNAVAPRIKVDTKIQTWPKDVRVLKKRLDEIKTELQEVGISYTTGSARPGKGQDPKRIIRLAFSPKDTQG